MLRLGREHWRAYSPFFDGADSRGGGATPADDADIDANTELGDAGKSAMKAERAARREAERRIAAADAANKDLQTRLADLEKKERDRAEQARKDAEDAIAAQGQYKDLAEQRERERDQLKTDLDAAVAERDALKAAANSLVKTDFDTLPEKVRALYPGAADDPVAMLAFIPKAKELAADMNGGAQNNSKATDGAEPNPPLGGVTKPDAAADEEFRKRNAQRYAW